MVADEPKFAIVFRWRFKLNDRQCVVIWGLGCC
jgi:hypothetical protein